MDKANTNHIGTEKPIVLIVEDEIASLNLLASYLENEGYRTHKAADGNAATAILNTEPVNVVLLDINIPGKDGLTLLREIRVDKTIGVILVTSKKDDIDRIVGLELGADDYVTKPYNPRELIVRVRNLTQRLQTITELSNKTRDTLEKYIEFSGWTLNTGRRVLVDDKQVSTQLTEGEYKLLTALMDRSGEVLSRDKLMNSMEGRDWFPNDRTIDVLIARLRKKLGDTREDSKFISTAHGAGYIFVAEIDGRNR